MNDEQLQSVWQKMKAPLQTENILSVAMTEMDALKKKIRRRNRREIAGAVLIIIIMGPFSFYTSNIYSRTGAVILTLSAIIIIIKMRNGKNAAGSDLTLQPVAYLHQHLAYLKKEAKLLSTVVYWYILPPLTGLALFFFGQDKSTVMLIFHYVILLIITGVVYWLNQMVVDTVLQPLIVKLDGLLKEEEQINMAGNQPE